MTTVGGLPAHILLVHAVVVFVPLSALAVVIVAVWPMARQRFAVATAVLAVATLVLVPVTTEAGEWLEHRVDSTALLREHTELGDAMLPWVIALAVVALAVAARQMLARRGRRAAAGVAAGGGPGTTRVMSGGPDSRAAGPGGRVVSAVLALLAVVVAVGSVVTVYRVGESGSRAVWTGRVSAQPHRPSRPPGATPGG